MRDKMLAHLAPRTETLTVDGVGECMVRELATAADVEGLSAGSAPREAGYRLLVRCLHDTEGNRIFADEDVPTLMKSHQARLRPLIEAAMRVNGWNVSEIEKNSYAAPAGG